jgi:hypothetical protein
MTCGMTDDGLLMEVRRPQPPLLYVVAARIQHTKAVTAVTALQIAT